MFIKNIIKESLKVGETMDIVNDFKNPSTDNLRKSEWNKIGTRGNAALRAKIDKSLSDATKNTESGSFLRVAFKIEK